MRSRPFTRHLSIWSFLTFLIFVLTACKGATPTPPPAAPPWVPPPGLEGQPIWITIQVQRVKILKDPGDMYGPGEFRFFVVASYGNPDDSAELVYPGRTHLSVHRGSVLWPGSYALSVDELSLEDTLYVYFLGVDIDKLGADDYMLPGLALSLLSEGVASAISMANPTEGAVIGWVLTAGGSALLKWIQEDDIVGQKLVVLRATENWQVGSHRTIITDEGGMEITYRVYRQTTSQPEPRSTNPNRADRPGGRVKAGMLNVRTGPSVQYDIITKIPRNTPVTITGRNLERTWLFVRLPDGKHGWVSAKWVVDTLPQPTATPRSRVFDIDYRGCVGGTAKGIGVVKGQVRDKGGNIIQGAKVEIWLEGAPWKDAANPAPTNVDGWYEWFLTPGQRVTFVSLTLPGQSIDSLLLRARGFEVKSTGGCFQYVNFNEQ